MRSICNFKSKVCFQTKFARHEVQSPLYYIHLEIAQFNHSFKYWILVRQLENPLNVGYHRSGTVRIKFIVFLKKKQSFGSKSCKIHPAHWLSLAFIFLQFDWLLLKSLNLSVPFSLAGEKVQFRAKQCDL